MRIKVLYILCCITNSIFTSDYSITKSTEDNEIVARGNTVKSYSEPRASREAKDDTLAVIISRIQKLSRIANGIYIQQELRDKSFVPDQFIAELFNLGDSLNIDDIDDSELGSALKSMDGMVSGSGMVNTTEDYLSNIGSQLKSSNITNDTKQWFEDEMYAIDFRRIGSHSFNFSNDKQSLEDTIHEWNSGKTTIKMFYDEHESDSLQDEIILFHAASVKSINQFSNIAKALSNAMSQLKTTTDDVYPLVQLSEFIKKMLQGKQPEGESVNEFKKYIRGISNAIGSVKKVRNSIETIFKLLSAHFGLNNNRKYTIGLLDGCKDLIQLNRDLSNKWFKENEVTGKLKKQLELFKPLESHLMNTGKVMETWSNEQLLIVSNAIQKYDPLVTLIRLIPLKR